MSHRETLSNRIALIVLLAALSVGAAGQEPGRIRVEVRAGGEAVAGATVVVAKTTQVTDAAGVALAPAPAGVVQVRVAHEGFVPVTVPVTLAGGAERVVRVELEPELTIEEEITVVASTRTGRRIEDQPLRVEALNREEIEEKMLMTPGDIVMMLNEMGGMRVQATSPSLGAASVRIQGMRGRYTRFLSDGLPLYGSQPGGLGLLQIPPMDLGQVEVIKGVASALHGAGAMGGVVNLLSRRPGSGTTICSGKPSNAIATTRASPNSRCGGRRDGIRGSPAPRSSTTPTNLPTSRGSRTPSPRPACSCRTTSMCDPGWRCRRADGWITTASTAGSSALACPRSCDRATGRRACRQERGSSGRRRSRRRPRRPA